MNANNYSEGFEAAAPMREEFLQAVEALASSREAEMDQVRADYAKDIFTRQEDYRNDFRAMLGWPLTAERKPVVSVSETVLGSFEGRTLSRLRLEVLPGLPFYGLLFYTNDGKKRPLVLSQHGGLGTPELCSSLYPTGSSNYNEQTRRLLKYDVNVFAPQLLLWDMYDEEGNRKIDNVREGLDLRLKSCGGSITSLELYALQVSLDWLCGLEFVDAERTGMAGLSYGGFYTLFFTALDTRVVSSVSSSLFGPLQHWRKPDCCWKDGGRTFQDAEIAALCWPRRIWLGMGKSDTLFDYHWSEAQYERLLALGKGLPIGDKIRYCSFEGGHEFVKEDEPISEMMADLKAELL